MDPLLLAGIGLILFIAGLLIGVLTGTRMGRGTQESRADFKALRQALLDSEKHNAALNARLEAEERHHAQQVQQLNEIRQGLLGDFKLATAQILENRQRSLTEDSGRYLGSLIKPLENQIRSFQQLLQETGKQEARDRGFLQRELEQLLELNQLMTREARELTEALKGSSRTMGTWGEMVLARVLESSGLENGREYVLQKEFLSPEGRRFRPDALIYLPGDRQIIIDSKVSLVAYERAFSSVTEQERQSHLVRHLESLRTHLRQLSAKRYDDLEGLHTPDFVLMFVPVEAALALGVQQDPQLFQKAMEQRILLVSPSSLYLSLRIIEQMWKGDRQEKNARLIAVKAGALYDKFESFATDMKKIGDKLSDAQLSWRTAVRRLSEGRGNILNRVSELKSLGAETRKDLENIDFTPDNQDP